MSEQQTFTYEEWHLLWKAVEYRATKYWALVERFQIASKELGPDSEESELWIHFLVLAEEQTHLLNKVEEIANESFPIIQETLFPLRAECPECKNAEEEIFPGENFVDLDKIKLKLDS